MTLYLSVGQVQGYPYSWTMGWGKRKFTLKLHFHWSLPNEMHVEIYNRIIYRICINCAYLTYCFKYTQCNIKLLLLYVCMYNIHTMYLFVFVESFVCKDVK